MIESSCSNMLDVAQYIFFRSLKMKQETPSNRYDSTPVEIYLFLEGTLHKWL